jgi:hypothetical protein
MLDADAWHNLGLSLKALDRYPEADEALLTAQELRSLRYL